ncbi:MAG: DUF3592 domain-containing protein [Polyangiaceae bacterium]|nr:DUF3592 domain-containing protein [Polyangiaceae bacterium]
MRASAEPPRVVPLKAQLAALLGSFVGQVGWALAALGAFVVIIFGVDSEAVTAVQFGGQLGTTTGVVQSVEKTNSSENKRTISRVRYRYSIDGKGEREGQSYAISPKLQPGQQVQVEFPVGRPERSRIHGLRARTFDAGGALTVIFPLVGLGLALAGLPAGLRRRRLLRVGKVAHAKLVSKIATSARVNKQPVYQLVFELSVPRDNEVFGYRQAAVSEPPETYMVTHKTFETRALEDDAEERFLYDPRNPNCAYPVDALPGDVLIDESGQLDASKTTFLSVLAPALALALLALAVVLALT